MLLPLVSQPTPPSGHPSEEGMGAMEQNGSKYLGSTYPSQLPNPLLGGVPGGRGGFVALRWQPL
jgi:hypothetical protein